jgi:transposase InsO family protein
MKDLYQAAGISKQAYHKYRKKRLAQRDINIEVISVIKSIRKKHRRMSCRNIYTMAKNAPVGRDKFERIGFENGYKVKIKRNAFKTTLSQKRKVFPNLLAGKELNDINQAWSSDIFCIQQAGKPLAYGIKIMDIYSRKILALEISYRQTGLDTVATLKKAIRSRKGHNLSGCIFHSDRGSQYISNAHLKVLSEYGMQPSMGVMPQENPYSERHIGIVKNDYLYELLEPETDLQHLAQEVMYLYNHERPHGSLSKMSPVAFEKYISSLPLEKRPIEYVYEVVNDLSPKRKVINKKKKEAKKKNV